MERTSQWSEPLAVVGSIFITSVTFWQYAQAHRAAHPGGYLPLAIGALLIGLLVAACNYFNGSRRAYSAIASGVVSAVVFIAVLLATLILCFGS
jgi:drug/metabolite transporter (DMT)-like permease